LGLDAEIIRDEEGTVLSLRRSISDLVERLEPVAERLGCSDELRGIHAIMERGTSATRQREVHRTTGDLSKVVDMLVDEMSTGSPRSLPNSDLVGGVANHGDRLVGER
jgi:carboxylate-amine ligase